MCFLVGTYLHHNRFCYHPTVTVVPGENLCSSIEALLRIASITCQVRLVHLAGYSQYTLLDIATIPHQAQLQSKRILVLTDLSFFGYWSSSEFCDRFGSDVVDMLVRISQVVLDPLRVIAQNVEQGFLERYLFCGLDFNSIGTDILHHLSKQMVKADQRW